MVIFRHIICCKLLNCFVSLFSEEPIKKILIESLKIFVIKTNLSMKRSVFWYIAPSSPLKVNRRFGGKCHISLRGGTINGLHGLNGVNNPEDRTLHNQRCEIKSYVTFEIAMDIYSKFFSLRSKCLKFVYTFFIRRQILIHHMQVTYVVMWRMPLSSGRTLEGSLYLNIILF
jgi:hypothetical protein